MRFTVLVLLPICLSSPASAQDRPAKEDVESSSVTEITLLAGADFVTGSVGDQSYQTVSLNSGITAQSGRFTLTAIVPYVVTTAPEELIVSNGGVLGTPLLSQPSAQSREVTRKGLGDLVLQGGYSLPLGTLNAYIAGNVKLPTASRDKALGTGEVDYGVSGHVSRRFGRTVPFASVSYTIVGEPEGFDVRNTLAGGVGSHFLIGEKSAVTVSYNYEQSATTTIADHQTVGLGLETDVSTGLRLGLDARAGLSSDAPDARVGVRVGLGF